MFQLTKEELENWKSQIVISNREVMGLRKLPFLCTEQGVSMFEINALEILGRIK